MSQSGSELQSPKSGAFPLPSLKFKRRKESPELSFGGQEFDSRVASVITTTTDQTPTKSQALGFIFTVSRCYF